MPNNKNPLAEIFGYVISNTDQKVIKLRKKKICPFKNKFKKCTKDKLDNPLGVCSIYSHNDTAIICPVRFKENWVIAKDAAKFFFPDKSNWKIIPEVKLLDANGNTAGNVDYVLVRLDSKGKIIDFGSLEVQSVYISGNLRAPFKKYMKDQDKNFTWSTTNLYPKPDYLSSSRKRLVPQIIYKGKIFNDWGKKAVVCIQKSFFETLPKFRSVDEKDGEVAWFIYDLIFNKEQNKYILELVQKKYSKFDNIIKDIITPRAGEQSKFINVLQNKLNNSK